MRILGAVALLVPLLGTLSPASAKSSNPAFLGVGMTDTGGRGSGPCRVDTITADSAASEARLQAGDEFVAIDGAPIAICDNVITTIQAREPGQVIKLDVRRGGQILALKVQLLSREEVLRRRFVGQTLPEAHVTRIDDRQAGELAPRGKTSVIGWFDKACVGCDGVFSRVARWSKGKSRSISVQAATAWDVQKSLDANIDAARDYARGLDIPLLIADPSTYRNFTITDTDRIHFMVVDCRGVVQHVAPVMPDGDDTSAVLDELYAATEQAARRMKQ